MPERVPYPIPVLQHHLPSLPYLQSATSHWSAETERISAHAGWQEDAIGQGAASSSSRASEVGILGVACLFVLRSLAGRWPRRRRTKKTRGELPELGELQLCPYPSFQAPPFDVANPTPGRLGAVSIECPAAEQSRSAALRNTIESSIFHFLLHHVIDLMATDFHLSLTCKSRRRNHVERPPRQQTMYVCSQLTAARCKYLPRRRIRPLPRGKAFLLLLLRDAATRPEG